MLKFKLFFIRNGLHIKIIIQGKKEKKKKTQISTIG